MKGRQHPSPAIPSESGALGATESLRDHMPATLGCHTGQEASPGEGRNPARPPLRCRKTGTPEEPRSPQGTSRLQEKRLGQGEDSCTFKERGL